MQFLSNLPLFTFLCFLKMISVYCLCSSFSYTPVPHSDDLSFYVISVMFCFTQCSRTKIKASIMWKAIFPCIQNLDTDQSMSFSGASLWSKLLILKYMFSNKVISSFIDPIWTLCPVGHIPVGRSDEQFTVMSNIKQTWK